jgi:hypothetical protein
VHDHDHDHEAEHEAEHENEHENGPAFKFVKFKNPPRAVARGRHLIP